MRSMAAALVFACLAIPAAAEARRFEFSPQFAASLPAGNIGRAYNPGFSLGVNATFWQDSTTGIGAHVAYHLWDATKEFNSALDEALSVPPFFVVSGSIASVGIIQATAHVRKLMPMSGAATPWFQVGAGIYDYKSRFLVFGSQLDQSQMEFGMNGELGIDVRAVGVDASYHYMLSRSSFDFGDHIQFFTVGVHFRLQ